jgi:hypothetical protein
MKNNPGPLRERNFPSRNMTAFSHWSATLIATETSMARTKAKTPIQILSLLAVFLYMTNADPTPIPRMTMKTSDANELLFLILITSMI